MEQPDAEDALQRVNELEQDEVREPIKDVETFWSRLDDVLVELESKPEAPTQNLRSFLYQPELLSVSSVDDIGNESENANNPFSYTAFTIRLQKPCLNAKGIQLVRANVPTPVTNIPDVACTFWYYKFVNWSVGSAYLVGNVVIDSTTNGNFYICISSVSPSNTVPSADPTHFSYIQNPIGLSVWDIGVQYNIGAQVAYLATEYYCKAKPPVGTLPTNTTFWIARTKNYIYMVRLQPSWIQPELVGTQYAYNRTFTDYNDLVTELNKACAADPIGSPFNSPLGNFSYLANDISFAYDPTYNKITMTGNNTGYVYLPAGYLDPNVFDEDYLYAASDLLEQTTTNISAEATGTLLTGGYIGNGQPYAKGQTLNLRLGWTWAGNYLGEANFKNLMRPVPLYTVTISGLGTLTRSCLVTYKNIAPSYACLVNTASVSIYMDVVGGSSQDSSGAAGILASVPLNAGNNTVGFFDKVLSHSLTKIPAQLQELRFYLKDEHGNDFYLPNSAVVTLELGVEY